MLVTAALSRDYRKFHTGFVYFEWPNGEHMVSYFELPSDGGVIFRGHGLRGASLGRSREHAGSYD